jgi:hypothetical protein
MVTAAATRVRYMGLILLIRSDETLTAAERVEADQQTLAHAPGLPSWSLSGHIPARLLRVAAIEPG